MSAHIKRPYGYTRTTLCAKTSSDGSGCSPASSPAAPAIACLRCVLRPEIGNHSLRRRWRRRRQAVPRRLHGACGDRPVQGVEFPSGRRETGTRTIGSDVAPEGPERHIQRDGRIHKGGGGIRPSQSPRSGQRRCLHGHAARTLRRRPAAPAGCGDRRGLHDPLMSVLRDKDELAFQ